MAVWSDNFADAFFISFIVTVFVPDIEGIQNKVTYFLIGTACSVNVTSTCTDVMLICMTSVVANLLEGPPIENSLGP